MERPYPFKKEDLGDIENNGQNLFYMECLKNLTYYKNYAVFILYETEGDTRIKKISRYQQFRACMKALERVKKAKTPLEKVGLFGILKV